MKYLKSINEHADEVSYNSISDEIPLRYSMGGYPFIWRDDNKFELGEIDESHSNIHLSDDINVKTFYGRIWPKFKIISFWKNPTKEQLKIIIEKIKGKDFSILDNEWRIEVLIDEDFVEGEEIENKLKGFRKHNSEYKLIPIEKFEFSKNPSEEDYEWHLKNIRDKQELKNIKFGKEFWETKAKKDKPLKFKQALLKSESNNYGNKKIKKLNELFDSSLDYDIIVDEPDEFKVQFEFDGDMYFCHFRYENKIFPEHIRYGWHWTFGVGQDDNKYLLTNKNKPYKILSTIKKCVDEFVDRYNPSKISYIVEGEKKANLYLKFFNGYDVEIEDSKLDSLSGDNPLLYKLTK
jgi:hypothetical protein